MKTDVMHFPTYPTIPLLTRRPEIFSVKEVIATEKLHGCVTHKALITMADGSRRTISSLAIGDKLLGVDGGGRVATSEVTRVYRNGKAERWLKIGGSRRGAGRGNHDFALHCTPEHHVWHATKKAYVTAGTLSPGDTVTILRSELGLTPLQEQVLIGKMLGDGSLALSDFSANVSWGHCVRDARYTRWTTRALGDIDSGSEDTQISGYGSIIVRGKTVNNYFIKTLLEDFVSADGTKHVPAWVADRLTPIALAFWYMDDGSLSHTEGQEDRASFAVCGFDEPDCRILIRALARLGVEAIHSFDTEGYSRLSVGSDAAEALFLLVAPYIPPCMQHKLPERYRGHDGWLPSSTNMYKPMLTQQTIRVIEDDSKVKSFRYDIETTTHNYFANGVLVHNSNFRLFFPAGMESIADVRYGSRDVEDGTGVPFPLNKVKDWFKARPQLLTQIWEVVRSYGFSDVTVFGEAYGPSIKAKGVKYSTGMDVLFRAFDIMVAENFLTWDLFCEVSDKIGLPRVQEVWRGDPSSEAFDRLLEQPSAEGQANGIDDPKNLAEGVVIRSNPLLRDVFGQWLIVKCKARKFAEVAHAPTEKIVRGPTAADDFAAIYVTEGRVHNAIGRLHDRGEELKGAMSDMPALLREIVVDLLKEHAPEWAETGMQEKQLTSAVSKVLGPLYRTMLESGNA